MDNSLVINSTRSEVRVAILENESTVEVYIERKADRGVVGNIYRGRVVRVLPGMQAAFVDLGLERTGFLYVNDAVPRVPAPISDEKNAEPDENLLRDSKNRVVGASRSQPIANIADVVQQGQEILVQVQKEPIGTKGARLTRHITIPGRNLVYMPFSEHTGVSLRIEDLEERERLRLAVEENKISGTGFIVRTAAEGVEAEELQREARRIEKIWKDIEVRGESGPVPRLVFSDLDVVLRAIRDLFAGDSTKIYVDTKEDFERTKEFVSTFEPEAVDQVEFYEKPEPIFDSFGIEVEIERALERKVWLKSGGYIIIDQAEALAVVDVNSGRFVGKSSLEDTITQINLEAVKEVAYQVRLRNIGGIVIVDFIDMALAANREKVLAALEHALSRDRAKTSIVRMSEIGLVQMTRKRVRESLGNTLTDGCPHCNGKGFIKSDQTIANDILRTIVRSLIRQPSPTVLVNMHPGIADYLYETESEQLEDIEAIHQTRIIPVARDGYHQEHFELVCAGAD